VTAVPSRGRVLIFAGVMLLCLIAGSTPRVVGDGAEYLAQAMNFAMLDGPSLGRRALPAIQDRLVAFNPALANWNIEQSSVAASDGRRDFVHFWFYGLVAAPFLIVTDAVGLPPPVAFTLVNVAFFAVALWVALPRIGPAAALLLFGSPIVWWIDKPHTEVFCFALLCIALCTRRDRPWWSLVAAGMAATQYPPMAAVYFLILGVSIVQHRDWLRDRRFLAGAVSGLALAVLHPLYTYARHGVPTLLLNATYSGIPALAEIGVVIVDPAIGLIANAPLLVLMLILTAGVVARRHWRELGSADMTVAVLSAVTFLAAFARTANFRHGATPSMSRYALWLLPLAVPLLAAAWRDASGAWKRVLWSGAAVSAVVSVFAFHPGRAESANQPTWAAHWVWTRHPGWHDPLVEVFSEVMAGGEGIFAPVATPQCEKVLVTGRGTPEVAWPLWCYPAAVPAACTQSGAFCYANRVKGQYRFSPAPGRRHDDVRITATAAWTPAMAPQVRRLFDSWGWTTVVPPRRDLTVLRQATRLWAVTIGTDDDFAIVLHGIEPGALLSFRFPKPMQGALIDPHDGAIVRDLTSDEPAGALWQVDVPTGSEVLILRMKERAPE
jgi:hypothetical protein